MGQSVVANGLRNEVPTVVELFKVVGIDTFGECIFAKGLVGKFQHALGHDGLQ